MTATPERLRALGRHPRRRRAERAAATAPSRWRLARTRGLARLAGQGGRWLLPWACGLGISATLAYALNTAVVGASAAAPAAAAEAERADAGAHWVMLWSVDAAGTPRPPLACLARPGLFAADVIEVAPPERDRLLAELPCHAMDPAAGGT
jgi:hypothetical protein